MIDPTKTYRTRSGLEARIYGTDGSPPNGVHGAVKVNTGWISITWGKNGNFLESKEISENDLIEVKPTRIMWVNCYTGNESFGYRTREEADEYADSTRTACIKVTYTEGEGL